MDSLVEKLQTQGAAAAIDPFMLMSYINMKLRDEYNSLDALCDDLNFSQRAVVQILADAGLEYNPTTNKFW
ncbi:MAG: DUF4250 domain-containing protein [Bacteroidaceae bacterium]|nr:DUF4250 domain-containing protein [Bacteroidaceae bacterium]